MPDIRDVHAPVTGHPLADDAVDAFLAAVAAADPTVLVRKAVRQGHLDAWLGDRLRPRRLDVIALGKAAPRMLWGLVEASVPFQGLGVVPQGTQAPLVDTFRWLSGEHPVPGPRSAAAGKAVLEWVEARQGTPVLALLSGGASSVCEAFAGDEAEALRDWAAWLGEDIPIEEMNRRRAARSRIKGGRLGRLLAERAPAQAWLLADTAPATAAATVGSAPFFVPERPEAVPHRVLASNEDAVTAAALRLAAQGHQAYRHARRVSGSLEDELEAFLRAAAGLSGDTVALVAGGEPTLRVPQGSPPGGRCQHAAALAPRLLQELRLPGVFLAAATDGRDGATDAAGAWTTAADARLPAAARQLRSHEALDGAGRLVRTGATGTNVNEVWVYLGRPAA